MILLIVDEDPQVVDHVLGVLRRVGGTHEIHTASNLTVAENSAQKLGGLNVLIIPAIASSGENFFALRDSLRDRFPKLHVLFLNDYDISDYEKEVGGDKVLPKMPAEPELAHWAKSIGIDSLPDSGGGPDPGAESEQLLEGSPTQPIHKEIPVPVTAVVEEGGSGQDDEDLPVAGSVDLSIEGLGDYRIVRTIASHERTETHEAVQLSIGRTVALVRLKPEFCKNREAVREFRGAVRAKAAVSHPYITPVYEAHEESGAIFYTRELVEGLNLPQLAGTGKRINQQVLLQIVETTADCVKFMASGGIRRTDLEPRHIYLGQDAQVRLNNIAALAPKNYLSHEEEIAKVATAMRPLVAEKPTQHQLILPLLRRMRAGEFESWEELIPEAHKLSDRAEEAKTYSVSGRKFPGAPATSKKSLALASLAAICVSALAAFVIIPMLTKPKPIAPELIKEMPRIPAGEFVFLDGETRSIDRPFWIGKYEVTIAEYAAFLAAIEDQGTAFDHPQQAERAPDKVGHQPEDWDEYYSAAIDGGSFRGSSIDVNCPVTLVDWWDAHAYANWKGHRLPTEEEWSKAARGESGNIYPWGNEFDAKVFNSSDPDGDVFTKWCPVNAMLGDVSPFKVVGTAGNVSEWTASEDTHPEFFDRAVPVIRGGNFASPVERYPLNDRRLADSPDDRTVYTGFRTVSDTDPNL